MPATSDQVVGIIARVLAPYLGATMSQASARGLVERHSTWGGPIDGARLDVIIKALEPGLHVFVG